MKRKTFLLLYFLVANKWIQVEEKITNGKIPVHLMYKYVIESVCSVPFLFEK